MFTLYPGAQVRRNTLCNLGRAPRPTKITQRFQHGTEVPDEPRTAKILGQRHSSFPKLRDEADGLTTNHFVAVQRFAEVRLLLDRAECMVPFSRAS